MFFKGTKMEHSEEKSVTCNYKRDLDRTAFMMSLSL